MPEGPADTPDETPESHERPRSDMERALQLMYRGALHGRVRNIELAKRRTEERVGRAFRFGIPETAITQVHASASVAAASGVATAKSGMVDDILRTNTRRPDDAVMAAFRETGYLSSAQEQLDMGRAGYRTHFFASLQNPAIARHASRPEFHKAMLADPACDPAAVHRDRLMIESLLAQVPAYDEAFSMSGQPTRAYMDYWHIVYLYLCDDRVQNALWSDTRRALNLQEKFREIVWRYTHHWATTYHGQGVVRVINTKIAAACRRPLVVIPRHSA